MKVLRKIIEIDDELCDGCGQCVPSCAEGALEIVDGKARIVAKPRGASSPVGSRETRLV